ncbi:MAG: LON peptidase substrate-binding domain-containing protein, partial [Terrimonas sp.]|nr:LON peptidase substrate-binding domain-containing protein [Terrimonas sp.]
MKSKELFVRPEDEMEFMPIIPLNEDDSENADEVAIPSEIALLPLRNTVLFPGVVIPITVGRDRSVKAVNDAYKADKLVGVVAQKDSTIEEPLIKDLEIIGTVAKIIKLIKMPDGGTTIIIQGRKRFSVETITTEEPYFRATIKLLEEEKINLEEDQHFAATVSSIKDLASQIILLSPNMPSEASVILKNIENPAFLIHFVSSNINIDLKEKQELLEINDIKIRAEKLMHLLNRELQFAELKNQLT